VLQAQAQQQIMSCAVAARAAQIRVWRHLMHGLLRRATSENQLRDVLLASVNSGSRDQLAIIPASLLRAPSLARRYLVVT
jgi:hypothetical protein